MSNLDDLIYDHFLGEPVTMETLDGFCNYQSPFDTDMVNAINRKGNHYAWCYSRDRFAATGDATRLDSMLQYVTFDNPPLAPVIRMKTEQTGHKWSRNDFFVFFCLVFIFIAGFIAGLALLCTRLNELSTG